MDNLWLKAAFYQASRALGNTGINPAVGCIIVKDNQIVGSGYTSEGGRPHAEENALKMAGKNAAGATIYVTLEPCCLESNVNSCTNLIIKSGVIKVVIGFIEHNKLTRKKGIKSFKKHGIEIKFIKIELNNFIVNYSHYCYHQFKRPMISLKLATTADSKITYSNGSSKWITSKISRNHVQQIRSQHDGILVGKNTFLEDDPRLNVRIFGFKKPITRIILDTDLSLNINSNLINSIKYNPLIIFTNKEISDKKAKLLKSKGAKIYKVIKSSKGLLCLKSLLKILFELNFQKILVEGGAKTATSFLNENYCDFMYIYRSSSFVGSSGLHLLSELKGNNNFFLYNELFLLDNKLELWINKKIKLAYNKII